MKLPDINRRTALKVGVTSLFLAAGPSYYLYLKSETQKIRTEIFDLVEKAEQEGTKIGKREWFETEELIVNKETIYQIGDIGVHTSKVLPTTTEYVPIQPPNYIPDEITINISGEPILYTLRRAWHANTQDLPPTKEPENSTPIGIETLKKIRKHLQNALQTKESATPKTQEKIMEQMWFLVD